MFSFSIFKRKIDEEGEDNNDVSNDNNMETKLDPYNENNNNGNE